MSGRQASRKACHCKRSKCLKLYCECFASATYCGATCQCKECNNNAQWGDVVEEERQKRLAASPSAFQPKVFAAKALKSQQ